MGFILNIPEQSATDAYNGEWYTCCEHEGKEAALDAESAAWDIMVELGRHDPRSYRKFS